MPMLEEKIAQGAASWSTLASHRLLKLLQLMEDRMPIHKMPIISQVVLQEGIPVSLFKAVDFKFNEEIMQGAVEDGIAASIFHIL